MEFLAALPAIVGLVARGRVLASASGDRDDDWVRFLLECLADPYDGFDSRERPSVVDFLRLYVTLNA